MQISVFRSGKKRLNRSILGDIPLIIMMIAVAAFMALPLILLISNAFKPQDEYFIFPPKFFPIHPTLRNFQDLFNLMSNSWVPFSRYIFNTLFITGIGVFGHVMLASAAAYPLAKYQFPAKRFLDRIIILALMFSPEVTQIPSFLVMSKLGWINTYWSIIVPAFQFPLGLYLMRQFMSQIPDSLLEAAKIDGAGEFRILRKIVMPMVKPAWLTLIIFMVQLLWGSQFGDNFIYSEKLKPMSYALSQVILGGVARQAPYFAGLFLLMSFPIILFLFTQSQIVETMASSGLKD